MNKTFDRFHHSKEFPTPFETVPEGLPPHLRHYEGSVHTDSESPRDVSVIRLGVRDFRHGKPQKTTFIYKTPERGLDFLGPGSFGVG